jgi:hypothetical protein
MPSFEGRLHLRYSSFSAEVAPEPAKRVGIST